MRIDQRLSEDARLIFMAERGQVLDAVMLGCWADSRGISCNASDNTNLISSTTDNSCVGSIMLLKSDAINIRNSAVCLRAV